jgi:hypothetical protein
MSTDRFRSAEPEDLVVPARSLRSITPNDDAEIKVTRGIRVNVQGTVTLKGVDDSTAVAVVLLAGQDYPYRVKQVLDTGTDSDLGIVGLY